MTNPIGLYLHIPFCEKKCKYCDFYSSFKSEEMIDLYKNALIKEITKWGGRLNNRPIDTIYLGGGTPSLLAHRLPDVLSAVKKAFNVEKTAEITLELNPKGDIENILSYSKASGVNRLSIGMQSGINSELEALGRTHTFEDTLLTFHKARNLGFNNISLDLMIGLPLSNNKTLEKSLKTITDLNPEHISSYILKIEENTAFFKQQKTLNLPNEEGISEQYLLMCDFLENKGYSHYEISNFSKENYESRHNLKYWSCEEYIGIGPSAHSFFGGERFYYPRDLKGFLKAPSVITDGEGGDIEEYIMLSLRLKSGLDFDRLKEKFNVSPKKEFWDFAEKSESFGLINKDNNVLSLTNKGFLISNSIITEILERI